MIIDLALIKKVLPVAEKAGKAILDIYNSGDKIHVSVKADHTPLTIADKQSNTIITEGLTAIFPAIPILSEEGASVPYETRKNWEYYWCVDPLDGTKEFINRRDDFTVNIALMYNNHPVLGIIYAPVYHALYYGSVPTGCWLKKDDKQPEQLFADTAAKEWTAVGSRSHASEEEQALLAAYPVSKTIAAGSSLKFCRIAEGSAHIYYRYGPTMEWDTAAGHAIAESSGAVMTAGEGTPFLYNKTSLLNGAFICKVI